MARLVSVALVMLVFGIIPAHAVVLCAKPRTDGTFNTSIKLREACKPAEQVLDPEGLGLRGPAGPAGPAGQTGRSVTVVDANGLYVGVVSNAFASGADVVRRINGLLMAFGFDISGFRGTQFGLFFTTTDCTGTPHLPLADGGGTLVPLPTYVSPSGVAYYATPPSTSLTISSVLTYSYGESTCVGDNGTFTPPNSCCLLSTPSFPSVGDVATFDLNSLGLAPPFHTEGP